MTKDRQIVAMLIRRKRQAREALKRCRHNNWPAATHTGLYGQYFEAHNAAELARRILYETEL